jgi:hypothetical protein
MSAKGKSDIQDRQPWICTKSKLTKRVRILATNQRSNPSNSLRCNDSQPSSISIRPRQLFVECRNQFPLMIDNSPLVTDQHSRIPETADTCSRPLVEPYMSPDVVLRTSLLQRTDLWPIDVQALRCEAMKKRVVVDWS